MLGHRVNSEGLRGRANAPRRRRTQEDLYRVRPRFLSTFPSTKKRKKAAIFAGFCHPPFGHCGGAPLPCLRPQTAGEFAPYSAINAAYLEIRPHFHAVLGPHSSVDPCAIVGMSRAGGKRQHHLSFFSHAVREPGNLRAGTPGCVAGRGVR